MYVQLINFLFLSRLVILNISRTDFFMNGIRAYGNGAFGLEQSVGEYFNENRTIDELLKFSKDTFMMIPVVIYTKKNFYLLDALNVKLELFSSAGFFGFWQYKNLKSSTRLDDKSPKVLSLENLLGSFQILSFGLFLSFLVFMIEYCCARNIFLKRFLRTSRWLRLKLEALK